jgi:hypothetical protein
LKFLTLFIYPQDHPYPLDFCWRKSNQSLVHVSTCISSLPIKDASKIFVQWNGIVHKYRISHGLWCDVIFIEQVVCFLSHIYHPIPVFVDFILRRTWRRNTQCDIKKLSH